MSDTVTLTIDGQKVTAPADATILEAAKLVGINIPTLCYHPLLRPEGSCRVCVCKVTKARSCRSSPRYSWGHLWSLWMQ